MQLYSSKDSRQVKEKRWSLHHGGSLM